MTQTKMEEKQFLQIDYAILGIKKIRCNGKEHNFTDALKTTYSYLRGWKEAFPSYNKIADVFGITRDAAKERVKNLEAMGLVERIERPGQSNFYTVNEINYENVKGRSYSENKGTRHEAKQKETEAVTQTSPQEPQQPATNPALPSDVVQTETESSSDDDQDEQQTESPTDVYCADDSLTGIQSEQNETEQNNEEDKLQSLFEDYRSYCRNNQLDEKAYESNFGDFYDETFSPELAETFKRFMPFLMFYDWDEESEIFEDLGIPF